MKILRLAIAFALVGCSFRPGAYARDDATTPEIDDRPVDEAVASDAAVPWLTTHAYRKRIALSPGGAAVSLTAFPIPLRIAADVDIAAHARSDGQDFVVTAADGTTPLEHELAFYVPATGATELWVLVPTLPLDTSTALYVYYGGPQATPAGQAVWAAGYKGVWHMSDTTAANEIDSTAAGNDVTQATAANVPGASAGAAAAGVTIGRARMFDGVNDALAVADPANGSLDVGANDFSISLWVYAVQSNGLYDTPLYKGGTNGGNPGYSILAGTAPWYLKVMDQTSTYINPQLAAGPINGQWVHLAMSVQRTPSSEWTVYRDGVQVGQSTFNLMSFDGTAALSIGGVTAMFDGAIDEVRVYSRTLSSDWIAAEHASFTKPDFVAIGPEEMQ